MNAFRLIDNTLPATRLPLLTLMVYLNVDSLLFYIENKDMKQESNQLVFLSFFLQTAETSNCLLLNQC